MPVTFVPYPIPVVVEDGKEAYLLYVESGGQSENDIWTCVHCDGGIVRHYLTSQVKVYQNQTFNITKTNPNESTTDPSSRINPMAPSREGSNNER